MKFRREPGSFPSWNERIDLSQNRLAADKKGAICEELSLSNLPSKNRSGQMGSFAELTRLAALFRLTYRRFLSLKVVFSEKVADDRGR